MGIQTLAEENKVLKEQVKNLLGAVRELTDVVATLSYNQQREDSDLVYSLDKVKDFTWKVENPHHNKFL